MEVRSSRRLRILVTHLALLEAGPLPDVQPCNCHLFRVLSQTERHRIWQAISAGKECVSCQTTPNSWFTAVHHRETPDRIKAGQSDAGVVWKTEVLAAKRAGADIDAVELPPEDSLRNEVAYAIGALSNSPNKRAADAFLAFLRSPAGQGAYAKYGFVKASDADLAPKPIP